VLCGHAKVLGCGNKKLGIGHGALLKGDIDRTRESFSRILWKTQHDYTIQRVVGE
jgi:hypothetical protein